MEDLGLLDVDVKSQEPVCPGKGCSEGLSQWAMSVLIYIMEFHDGSGKHFAFGLKPIKVEEPTVSPVEDLDILR